MIHVGILQHKQFPHSYYVSVCMYCFFLFFLSVMFANRCVYFYCERLNVYIVIVHNNDLSLLPLMLL